MQRAARQPPVNPLQQQCQLCSGGHNRAIRCTCVISALLTEPTAAQKMSIQRYRGSLPPLISAEYRHKLQNLRIKLTDKFWSLLSPLYVMAIGGLSLRR
jgi:hypothetical protein